MDRQFFLELLKEEIEEEFIEREELTEGVSWCNDTWGTLSAMLDDFIKNTPIKEKKHLAVLAKKAKKKEEPIVSISTLERIYNSGKTWFEVYDVSEPIHPSRRFVLDVLCMFLKYENWKSFWQKKKANIEFLRQPSAVYDGVRLAVASESLALNSLPNVHPEILHYYFHEDGNEYWNIVKFLRQKKGLYLDSDPRFNQVRILGYIIEEIDFPFARVKTALIRRLIFFEDPLKAGTIIEEYQIKTYELSIRNKHWMVGNATIEKSSDKITDDFSIFRLTSLL